MQQVLWVFEECVNAKIRIVQDSSLQAQKSFQIKENAIMDQKEN